MTGAGFGGCAVAVVDTTDVETFLEILPDWDELSKGLKGIVLAYGEDGVHGWHVPGLVAICAWPRKITDEWDTAFYEDHRPILERLGVATERRKHDIVFIDWDDRTARGFQLMHVFLHELGHHHDRMTTRYRHHTARGEPYAEQYANEYAERIWEDYFRVFGW